MLSMMFSTLICVCVPSRPLPCKIVPWHQAPGQPSLEEGQAISSMSLDHFSVPDLYLSSPSSICLKILSFPSFLYYASVTCITLQSEIQSPRFRSFHATHKHKPTDIFVYVLEILTIMKIQRMIKTNKGRIQKFKKLIIVPDCTTLGSTRLARSA